jgi:hypothetical protein
MLLEGANTRYAKGNKIDSSSKIQTVRRTPVLTTGRNDTVYTGDTTACTVEVIHLCMAQTIRTFYV